MKILCVLQQSTKCGPSLKVSALSGKCKFLGLTSQIYLLNLVMGSSSLYLTVSLGDYNAHSVLRTPDVLNFLFFFLVFFFFSVNSSLNNTQIPTLTEVILCT